MSSLIQRQLDTLKGLGLSGGALRPPARRSPRLRRSRCATAATSRRFRGGAAAFAVPGLSRRREARRQRRLARAEAPHRRAGRAFDGEDGRLQAAHGCGAADARGSAGGRGLPTGMEGARLSADLRPLERLAHLGHRRQRIHRSRQRLRTDRVRTLARFRRRGDQGAIGQRFRDRAAGGTRGRSRRAVHRDDRQ